MKSFIQRLLQKQRERNLKRQCAAPVEKALNTLRSQRQRVQSSLSKLSAEVSNLQRKIEKAREKETLLLSEESKLKEILNGIKK